MTDAVLYDYWRSSASYRVRIALALAGITYDRCALDLLAGDHRSPAHLERNPQGLVPVLEIDGQRFTQSLAILTYLDVTRALGLVSEDPVERAYQEALAQSIAVDLHPVCNLSVASYGASQRNAEPDMRDWMQHFIAPGLASFSRLLDRWSETTYCTGTAPGLADICLIPQLYNARRWGIDLTPFPRLLRVEDICSAHPAFAAAHPDRHRPLGPAR
ncbi:maleylacetoacetate isomerase [Phaeobacter sp. B1627]|uniref:maleylacetoacetate isomerase n=1 Tax=Phaeobacter sp. B1627 TaxID=2583809 RepID=UPI00111BC098|nr:maleylacetoacetate isomerase [Phaeobacter sp. B1627]TNJ41188.1 maleylacetoacetate isomerase [Phaeobacter sp. B1627]